MPDFVYQNPFPVSEDKTSYYKIEASEQYVTVENFASINAICLYLEGRLIP